MIAGFALTESDAGSDAAGIRATATRTPDGYVLNGRKQWCTNGSYAGVIMGMFRTGGSGAKGVSAFLIDGATGRNGRRKGDGETRHPHEQHVRRRFRRRA